MSEAFYLQMVLKKKKNRNKKKIVQLRPINGKSRGRWSDSEHELFLEAFRAYGRNWEAVSMFVKTRTVIQARTHAQKYFLKIKKDKKFYMDGFDDGVVLWKDTFHEILDVRDFAEVTEILSYY